MLPTRSACEPVFEEAGVPSPRYVEMSPEMGPLTPLETLEFPLVVKPVDNMGARGVRRVDTEAELIDGSGEGLIIFPHRKGHRGRIS